MTRSETQRALFDAVVAVAVTAFDQQSERKVIDNRFFEDSEHDLNDLCIISEFTGGTEMRYLLIEATRTEDIDSGLDDCPRFFCNFSFHLFDIEQDRRYNDAGETNDSNSTLDFMAAVEKLHEIYKPRRLFGTDTFNERLQVLIPIQNGQVDPITKFIGHYADFSLRVEKECDCA